MTELRHGQHGRVLQLGQRCEIWIFELAGRTAQRVFVSQDILLEAPNWLGDDLGLLVNGDGELFRLSLRDGDLHKIAIAGAPPANNDHVLAPDGQHVYFSADDGHVYRAPVTGGPAQRISSDAAGCELMHFLHGIDPSGNRLCFIGIARQGTQPAQVYTMSSVGDDYHQLTRMAAPADGCEFSPDGHWIYYNTSAFDGCSQIARMRADGSAPEQLSHGTGENWFPHLSPDRRHAVFLSFPRGTQGHPADMQVDLKLVELSHWDHPLELLTVPGGQGTLNVNSWSPDGRCFAYVTYPIGAD
ncbi:TolB family protein [Xanthomonas euvesicatoria]|uniref:TolB family protein n=1 Tax=Xanthomonas euvesicatoria TaxID=456327 RepID=UPI001C4722FE|nr:hypothetical protein [Xanthomonas euvesicatoria]MBV6791637.1 hypothetical protein [Xanthomonas campestris pv. clerodendri]